MLLVPLRSAGKGFADILEDLQVQEGDEFELLDWPSWESARGNKVLVNVDAFGAVGDGVSDDTQVIQILLLLS